MKQLGLKYYDATCRTLSAARKVDEVDDIQDKAIALEKYSAQAMNMEMETYAREIRLRAERKVVELLKEMGREPGKARASR